MTQQFHEGQDVEVRALDPKLVQTPRTMRDVSVWGRRLGFTRKVLFLFFSKS